MCKARVERRIPDYIVTDPSGPFSFLRSNNSARDDIRAGAIILQPRCSTDRKEVTNERTYSISGGTRRIVPFER